MSISARDQKLLNAKQLLNDIPFGYVNDRVVTPKTVTEADIVAWVQRAYDVQRQLQEEDL